MKTPLLLDTTLRDGEQSPGLYFTHEEKLFLAIKLDELGVEIIEAGIPGMGQEEQCIIRKLVQLKLKADILPWNRLVAEDVIASLKCGVSQVHLSVPTSPQMLSRKMCKEPSWVFDQMETVIRFAVEEGLRVSLGAEDASRTDQAFLSAVFRHAQNLGAVRVRYADTLGLLTPERTSQAIGGLTEGLDIPLDFHAHNDFGLATANSLAAWKAGAKVISCTLLGLGERAGNASMEEFVGACHFLEGLYPDFPFPKLRGVCETLAFLSKRPIAAQKPLFGSGVFSHESGIHVDGLLKSSETYEPFAPEAVGGKRSLVIGKHSGRASLKHLASESGLRLEDGQVQLFLDDIRARMSVERDVDADTLFQSFLHQVQIHLPSVMGLATHE